MLFLYMKGSKLFYIPKYRRAKGKGIFLECSVDELLIELTEDPETFLVHNVITGQVGLRKQVAFLKKTGEIILNPGKKLGKGIKRVRVWPIKK